MSLNQGIQRYRNTLKVQQPKESEEPTNTGLELTQKQSLSRAPVHLVKQDSSDVSPLTHSKDELIVKYAPLIKYIAQKIAARLPPNIELDDLMSAGVIGLMDAIKKYDSSRDNKFKTYAEFRIRGAILDELRAQDWIPRSIRDKAKLLEKCYTKIEREKGRHATKEEVCQELKISKEELHKLLSQVRNISLVSYDDPSNFSNIDKRALHYESETREVSLTPFQEINNQLTKKLLASEIKLLPAKQSLVLYLYYYEGMRLKEIGEIMDVTESRVSQLHTEGILKLKSKLRSEVDNFF